MESFIEQHKGPQLRAMLSQFYADAKAIGYLKSYKIDIERKKGGKMDILHLSKSYYAKMIAGKV